MLLTSISFLLLLADLIERVRHNIPYLKSLFYLIAFRRNLSPVFCLFEFLLTVKSSANTMCRQVTASAVTDIGLGTAWYIAHGIGHK